MRDENKKFQWIGELVADNFLAVYDIVIDLKKAFQMSEDIVIPLLPTMIKFRPLMPADSINLRDDYCDIRWKATTLLKEKKVIENIETLHGSHRRKNQLRIKVNKSIFTDVISVMESEYKQRIRISTGDKAADLLEPVNQKTDEVLRNLFLRFHSIVIQLRQRHDNRATLDVTDEYDVQDLLHILLKLYFNDIRPEEWTPSYAGKTSRVDFLLKREKIVIEVKKTRQGLGGKEIGDQLIIDTVRYSKMDDCSKLICFIYDPENRIVNPGGLEADLGGEKDGIIVEVFITP